MNNEAFRRLVGDTPRQIQQDASPIASSKPQAAALGSRLKSSIPMTPRSVGGHGPSSFARQLAESRAQGQPQRKFKAMAAPRGVKLAKGYQDRAAVRAELTEDEREARIKALEEQVKLGQIDQSAFEQMRDEITGGDVSATHLVKGLDMKLLERVRRGEDVFAETMKARDDGKTQDDGKPALDEDLEFDELERKEFGPIERETVQKKGEMAPPSLRPVPVAGVKRSRDDILAELKAQRQAAADARAVEASKSGSKFKTVNEMGKASSRIETDENGREVLITVDEYGKVKRKVRKVAAEENPKRALPMPDKSQKPLGMEVPKLPTPPPVEDEDDDIFEGVGDSYDPLGAADDDDDSELAEEQRKVPFVNKILPSHAQDTKDAEEKGSAKQPQEKRNYFNDTPSTTQEDNTDKVVPFQDPMILAALKRAAAIERKATESKEKEDSDKSKKSTAAERLLGTGRDRDYDDMDMGFGASRGDDEDDGEDVTKIKLSEWKNAASGDDDEDKDDGGKGGKQRKRGKKKRKGDKNSAADIMKVIEGRK